MLISEELALLKAEKKKINQKIRELENLEKKLFNSFDEKKIIAYILEQLEERKFFRGNLFIKVTSRYEMGFIVFLDLLNYLERNKIINIEKIGRNYIINKEIKRKNEK